MPIKNLTGLIVYSFDHHEQTCQVSSAQQIIWILNVCLLHTFIGEALISMDCIIIHNITL